MHPSNRPPQQRIPQPFALHHHQLNHQLNQPNQQLNQQLNSQLNHQLNQQVYHNQHQPYPQQPHPQWHQNQPSAPNPDVVWAENWVLRKQSQGTHLATSTPSTFTSSLIHLNEAVQAVKDLESEYEKASAGLQTLPEDQWASQVEKISGMSQQILNLLDPVRGKVEPKEIASKLRAKERKKRWRKRHLQRLKEVRGERAVRRHEQVDAWRREWEQRDKEKREREAIVQEAEEQIAAAEKDRAQIKETKKLVKGIQRLREVRREGAKAKGRFLPEEDRQFQQKIREVDDILHNESKRLEKLIDAIKSQRKEKLAAREDQARDPVKDYFLRAEWDFEGLVQIRRQWDSFLVPAGFPGASTIPAGPIRPSPPASALWATTLVAEKKGV